MLFIVVSLWRGCWALLLSLSTAFYFRLLLLSERDKSQAEREIVTQLVPLAVIIDDTWLRHIQCDWICHLFERFSLEILIDSRVWIIDSRVWIFNEMWMLDDSFRPSIVSVGEDEFISGSTEGGKSWRSAQFGTQRASWLRVQQLQCLSKARNFFPPSSASSETLIAALALKSFFDAF